MIAKIIIDISHHAVDQTYDYIVPFYLENHIEKGMRVEVSFSGGIRTGIVIGFKKTSTLKNLKEINQLLDETPILSETLLEAALHLKKKYAVPLFEIIQLLIPDFKRFKKTKILTLIDNQSTYREYFKNKLAIPYPKTLSKDLKKGLKDHKLEIGFTFKEKGSLRKDKYYVFNQETPVKNKSQEWLLNHLKKEGPKTKKTLKNYPDFSESSLKTLVKSKAIDIKEVPHYLRLVHKTYEDLVLSETDQSMINALQNDLKTKPFVSMTGAFDDGLLDTLKKLIKTRKNQRILLVLPEIIMVEAMALRLSLFMDVTVYHSKMSAFEKKDSYERFLKGILCITTPSGFFLDLENTDLVIIKDIHDPGYQSLDRPRFDLIEDATQLKSSFNFELLYVSPSLPIFLYHRKEAWFLLNENKKKVSYHVADLKSHVVKYPHQLITETLDEKIKAALSNNESVLLIHHQKGAYKHLKCFKCGHMLRCETCLNLVSFKDDMPYCETCNKIIDQKECENCHIPYVSVDPGLDVLKEEIQKKYNINPLVFTSDMKEINEFLIPENRPKIVIGTKGLLHDYGFEAVGCIGFILFDELIYNDDYMNAWIKGTMISQASAMVSNRKDVVIQTYNKDSRIFNHLADLSVFFESEYLTFKKLGLPPFKDMVQIILKGDENKRFYLASNGLNYLKKALRDHATYLGPIHHHHMSIITVKSDDLSPYYGSFNALYKTFSEEISLEIRHFKFRK